jgi:hypothetical protein
MTAFAHWTAMHAWWIARRTEKDAIGKPWAARKAVVDIDLNVEPRFVDDDGFAIVPGTTVTVVTPAPRKRAPVQRSKQPLPDEGGPVTDADIETMKKAYAALPAKASAWATRVMVQGNDAPLPWNKLSVAKTVRRYELYRGVRQVAAYAFADDCDCDSNADEVVRAIVHAVTFDAAALFPTVPPGMVLASLCYLEAIKFSEVASDLAQNRYSLLADSTGVLRLAPVA